MGTNNFVALATINPGDFGPQASVDLWTLVPTTGLAPQWNAICVGDFSGSIVVEANGNTIWSGTTSPLRPTIVANGANVIAWNNSPVAVLAPARHFTMPDGLGGVLTIPSLT